LSYYFDPAGEYALVASRKGVTLQGLRGTRGAVERLRGSRVSDGGNAIPGLSELDAIGAALLGPVADLLSNRIYLLPSGDLTGFPFDALRLEGEFLAANHTVVKLMSLASVQRRRPLLAADYRGQVFLAGSPQASQELFSYDMPVSAELAALTDMFVGPGLNIVQGVALRRDEFRDSRFTSSSLIHLAIPGTLDLAYPAQSRLQMSSAGSEAASQDLAPADINTLELEASLVVLSQTGTVSGSRSGFDSRLGFVSDILEAGAANVLASLWPTADSETAVFMREFYRTLDSDPDLVEALSGIRKSRMKSGGEANLDSWAGFQLYIR
jgi:CHAT domain-containing protein